MAEVIVSDLERLLAEIAVCRICEGQIPEPRPVLRGTSRARLLIIGQAPGSKVHASGKPWDDASGSRLRAWMGLTDAEFYDPSLVAIVPMGFCYPGRGKSGDLATNASLRTYLAPPDSSASAEYRMHTSNWAQCTTALFS
jgi:uracil-DNA glycosylase